MKLSKTSLIFRLHKFFESDVYRTLWYTGGYVSLCTLFWSTVAYLFVAAVLSAIFIIAAAYLIYFVVGWGLLLGGVYLDWWKYEGVMIGILILNVFSWIILISSFGKLDVYPNWWPERLRFSQRPAKNKKLGIIGSYIKAKKEKICPLVGLED